MVPFVLILSVVFSRDLPKNTQNSYSLLIFCFRYYADNEQTPIGQNKTNKTKRGKDENRVGGKAVEMDPPMEEEEDGDGDDGDGIQSEESSGMSAKMGRLLRVISALCGIVCVAAISIAIPTYLYTLHENRLWFSRIMVSAYQLTPRG